MFSRIYEQYDDFLPDAHDVVYDVGAQFGDYALICDKLYNAKVYAFEPLPINHRRMTELHKMHGSRARLFSYAIGETHGKADIYFSSDKTGSTMMSKMQAMQAGSLRETVEFVSLDSFVESPDIEPPTLLKIDVEGYELDVIRGASKLISRFKPRIILEAHSSFLECNAINLLLSAGYQKKHEGRRTSFPGVMDTVVNLFFAPTNNSHRKV